MTTRKVKSKREIKQKNPKINMYKKKISNLKELLKESKNKYRRLVELYGDIIYIHCNGKIVSINKAGVKLLGAKSDKEIIGRNLMDLIHPDYKEVVKKRIKYILENDAEVKFIEEKIIRLDGIPMDVEVCATPFIYRGEKAIQVIVRDITKRKNNEKKIEEYSQKLRDLYVYLQNIREEERKNISRKLHDEIGQLLIAFKLDLSFIQSLLVKEKLNKNKSLVLKKIKGLLLETDSLMKIIKEISAELRPAILDRLGLIPALKWQAKEFEKKTGIICNVSLDKDIKVDQEISIAIFRIFQEALTNIYLHSKANKVMVKLKQKGGVLNFEIKDNGIGISRDKVFNPKSFGLIGMEERAKYLGGSILIKGIKNKGTTILLKLPLNGTREND